MPVTCRYRDPPSIVARPAASCSWTRCLRYALALASESPFITRYARLLLRETFRRPLSRSAISRPRRYRSFDPRPSSSSPQTPRGEHACLMSRHPLIAAHLPSVESRIRSRPCSLGDQIRGDHSLLFKEREPHLTRQSRSLPLPAPVHAISAPDRERRFDR